MQTKLEWHKESISMGMKQRIIHHWIRILCTYDPIYTLSSMILSFALNRIQWILKDLSSADHKLHFKLIEIGFPEHMLIAALELSIINSFNFVNKKCKRYKLKYICQHCNQQHSFISTTRTIHSDATFNVIQNHSQNRIINQISDPYSLKMQIKIKVLTILRILFDEGTYIMTGCIFCCLIIIAIQFANI